MFKGEFSNTSLPHGDRHKNLWCACRSHFGKHPWSRVQLEFAWGLHSQNWRRRCRDAGRQSIPPRKTVSLPSLLHEAVVCPDNSNDYCLEQLMILDGLIANIKEMTFIGDVLFSYSLNIHCSIVGMLRLSTFRDDCMQCSLTWRTSLTKLHYCKLLCIKP